MRQIERELIAAIDAQKTWAKDNTRVDVELLPSRSLLLKVSLHGNQIARIEATPELGIIGMRFTLAGWNTRTTKSRLNAILKHYAANSVVMGIGTHKGKPEFRRSLSASHNLECQLIESDKWYSVTDNGFLLKLA